MILRIKEGQTLMDLALIALGDWETAWNLARDNGLALTARLCDGDKIEVGEVGARGNVAARVVAEYAADGVEPASEATAVEEAECPSGGIGYMMVGCDFEVS